MEYKFLSPMESKLIELGFDKVKLIELDKFASENGGDEVEPKIWYEKATELFGDEAQTVANVFGVDI